MDSARQFRSDIHGGRVMQVNEVTKEVSATIEGEAFRFRASTERLADFEARCDGVPFAQLWLKSARGHAGTTLHGLQALCVDGPKKKLGEFTFSSEMIDILSAIVSAALPPAADDEGDTEGGPEGNANAAGTA